MPNRMLRDWTNSDKVDSISYQAEVFFTRLIMKADDYGCFYADSRLLKANLFPLRLDKIREADLLRWMAECQKAGLIVLYASNQKPYLQIQDFRQRLDKAKQKFPLPLEKNDSMEVVNDFPSESDIEEKPNKKRANALVVASDADSARRHGLKNEYKKLLEQLHEKDRITIWNSLKIFIHENKPDFAEPHVDAWNLFASTYKLSEVKGISDSRKKKFLTRLQESSFDFLKILEKTKTSAHLKGDNQRGWKITFDWIVENDKNYLKILEGNYD